MRFLETPNFQKSAVPIFPKLFSHCDPLESILDPSTALFLYILGLRRIEWVILGVENSTNLGIARGFCILAGLVFGINDGWHEHRDAAGGFGIRIRFLVFGRDRQCAGFSVIRKRA
jgi:hypothetical protein